MHDVSDQLLPTQISRSCNSTFPPCIYYSSVPSVPPADQFFAMHGRTGLQCALQEHNLTQPYSAQAQNHPSHIHDRTVNLSRVTTTDTSFWRKDLVRERLHDMKTRHYRTPGEDSCQLIALPVNWRRKCFLFSSESTALEKELSR